MRIHKDLPLTLLLQSKMILRAVLNVALRTALEDTAMRSEMDISHPHFLIIPLLIMTFQLILIEEQIQSIIVHITMRSNVHSKNIG